MKKIYYLLISFILLVSIFACADYKPIFSTTNLKFNISDYSIVGDKKIGNKIYTQLHNLFLANKDNNEVKNIELLINILKEKNPTTKDKTGKILAYRIYLSTTITLKDFSSGNEILKQNFSYSASFNVQDQYSETIKLENKSIESLVDKTYKELLIKLSESI
jgi:hypothetical protein